MKERITFFLPTRKGSERVKNKNTKPFAGIEGGLMENKIKQLVETTLLDEIILSSNDEICMAIAEKYAAKDSRVRIIPRPEELCLSSTNLQDLICYVPTITDAEHILWGHVTTPLACADQYDAGIQLYLDNLKNGYDSLVGVTELKNFLLNKEGKLVNNTTDIPWPRTQDLEALYPSITRCSWPNVKSMWSRKTVLVRRFCFMSWMNSIHLTLIGQMIL